MNDMNLQSGFFWAAICWLALEDSLKDDSPTSCNLSQWDFLLTSWMDSKNNTNDIYMVGSKYKYFMYPIH